MTRPQGTATKSHYVRIHKIENAMGQAVFIEGYMWGNSEQAVFGFRAGKERFSVPLHEAAYVASLCSGTTTMLDSFWLDEKGYRELTRVWWTQAKVFYSVLPP